MASLNIVKRAIDTEAGFGEKLLRSSLAVIIPTALRWFIDRGALGEAFVIYFPATLVIAVLFGWRWAMFTTAGSVLAVLIMSRIGFSAQTSWVGWEIVTLYVLATALTIAIGDGLRKAVIEVEQQARLLEQYNGELQHRTKNIFQMVRALAARASRSTSPTVFYEDLTGRLEALSKANEILKFGVAKSCSMTELMNLALSPFRQERITVEGPDCQLSEHSCGPLVLALHELATNACKYGALSIEQGFVEIRWALEDDQTVRLTWRETGGPPVEPPTTTGLGTRLLAPRGDLKAVELRFDPTGVCCEITATLA